MKLPSVIFLLCALIVAANARDCPNVKRINSKLICYYSKTSNVDSCYCTHVVLPVNTDVKEIDNLRRKLTGVKILLTVNEFNQGLVDTVKQNSIDGLELNLKNLKSKEDITDFISTVRTKFGNDLYLALSIPPKTELLAKYYDLKALTKTTDLFILQTAFLGAAKNVTFHPSRLSGMWDMQNTDSVVDLVTGLGAPLSRLAVTAPVQAFQFRLQDSGLTTPGSPALELETITRRELCKQMSDDKEQSWTLERDQDQAGPYIFRGTSWIAFEDATSLDIKAKYTRVRGLAGLALKDLSLDTPASTPDNDSCGSLLAAAHAGLSKQNRAPRGAVLRSLEREILDTPTGEFGVGHPLEKVNVSPYRITRIVDVEGHVHSVRKDTRTEFTCSRQGYFVHPQSCGRFYRCVKFDQLTEDFSVFEFDCPAGLAFDERVEVCVWPGSLPHGAPCQGSSEIAPVPRGRFSCPSQPGYYADPENCRWFFACLDHGQSEMTAYEFRCPFGLVFDEKHLLCQWPWLVPSCGNGHITGLELDSIEYYGGAAKSTLVSGGHNLNVHLTGGAQVLDSYDGLGSLGAVTLGGYQGDINVLKNSLQSHGIGSQGTIGLVSGNDGAYYAQNGFGSEGSAQNIDSLQFGLNGGSSGGYESGLTGNQHFAISFNQYEGQHGANLELSQANLESSQENLGLSQTAFKSSDFGLNSEGQLTGNQEKVGVIHFGTSLDGHSSNIQHGLSSSDINFGLLGKQQESFANLNGASNVEYQENSGYGHGQIYSGIQSGEGLISTGEFGNKATSSVEFNKYSQGGQFNSETKYQDGNDKLVLTDYKVQTPVQQTVLLDSAAKSHEYAQGEQLILNGAKSSTSNVQYFGNHGNSEQTVLLNSGHHNTGAQSGTSYQTIQHSIPVQTQKIATVQSVPLQSTVQLGGSHSGTLNYNYQYGNEGKYVEQPIGQTGSSYSSISFGTKLTHIGDNIEKQQINYAPQYYAVTPKTEIFNLKSKYQYQTPVVQYEQKVQPVVLKSEGAKSHSYSSIHHYQSPVVQKVQPVVYKQKVQPIVYEQKVEQPIVYEHKQIQPVVLKTEGAKSHSSTYHYQAPVVQYEQKIQPVVQQVQYEQKVQPIAYKTEGAKSQSHSYSSVNHYHTPSVQYEQKLEQPLQQNIEVHAQQYQYEQNVQPQIHLYNNEAKSQYYGVQHTQEIKTPVVQHIAVSTPRYEKVEEIKFSAPEIKQTAYSTSFLKHEVPVVQYEQKVQQPVVQYEQKVQPIVYEQKVEQPIVYNTQSEGAKSHSFSQIHHYQNEGVKLEQKVQPIVYEQKVQQPIVYEQKIEQPVIYQKQSEGAKSHSFSQIHHYQNEGVQLKQKVQPIVYEQKVQQPIIYEQKVEQPIVYQKQSEGAKSHSFSQIHHYQNEGVQLEQKVQPIVYEQKVQQPIVYEQKVQQVQPVVYKTESENAKSHSFSQIHHYQSEQKVQPIIQQSIEYKQPVQHITVTPKYETQYYEQKVQQPVVHYEQKVQPIVYEQKIQQPIIYNTESQHAKSHSFSQIHHYENSGVQKVQPIVYEQKVQQPIVYEQKVQQPIIYEQKIQPAIYKTESENAKSHSFSQIHHYQSEQKVQPIIQQSIEYKQPVQHITVTPKYETQYYEQKLELPKIQTVTVTPKYEQSYQEINIPVVQQPSGFVSKFESVTPKYETHSYSTIKHHISAPKVETISVTPKYETQYYSEPAQPITYEAKVPVIEPKVVQKFVQPLYAQPAQPAKIETTYYGRQEHVQVTAAPQIVKTYLQQESREYLPPKPTVNYVTPTPVVHTYFESSTPKPIVNTYYVSTPKPKPQVYVSTTPKYSVFQEYVQPKQTFEIKKTVQPVTYQTFKLETPVKIATPAPTIVESYSYLPPKVEYKENRQYLPPVTTARTYLPVKQPEVYVSSTPKYNIFQEYVQKQAYEVKKPSPTVIAEYQYENPDFAHYESKLNFNSAQDLTYQPKVQSETVYYSTQKPVKTVPLKTYQTDYILSTPRPTFVSTIAPIVKQTPTLRTKVVAINKFQTEDNRYLISTPKPIYISTPAPVLTKTEAPYGEFKYYDSRYDSAAKQVDYESSQYLKETADEWNQFGNYEYVDTTPKVKYVTSTVRPILRKKIVSTTTAIPVETYQEYYDDKFDSQYIVSTKPTVTTTYRPSTIRPIQRKKIVSTTTDIYDDKYNNEYVITTSRRPVVIKKKKIVTTTAVPVDYDEYYVSTAKPSVKITPRPKGKTIVRVNDFHPFLTTKLGAQCTCTSNTLELRKSKQKENIQEYDVELPDNVPVTKITSSGPTSYDDYNEPGVYVVGNSDSFDYDYESKKVVAVTKSPEYIIKSTTNAAQPAPTPIYSIRKKVTTLRPEPEIYLSSTPASEVIDEVFVRRSKSKEQKIAEAVNEGLSLVKSAIKGYVKDAVNEEVRNFDRYGPGGWRSRDETLQGNVDCKRAGLFRHPTQCNKFYACHWDCTKQRYTLAVFNCPVHLTFDTTQGACNWPSKGPACTDNTLLPSA